MASPEETQGRTSAGAKSAGRILIVEDEDDHIVVLKQLLELFGYDVMAVKDPTKVSQVVAEFRPDLVFLDVMLPNDEGIDGFDVCRELRENPQNQGLKIFIMSAIAKGHKEGLAKLRDQLHADEFIAKPYDPGAVLAKIQQHLG